MPDGLSTVTAPDTGLKGSDRFRVFAGNVGGIRLVVGQSYSKTDDLEAIALISFGWAAGIIVVIAIAGGALLAGRAQTRLDDIARTMVDVSNGQLGSRIPLHGNRDDIAFVSSQINQALDRLSGLVEGMRQVSADIAHELKTPLNRLKMTIEEALTRSDLGESVETQLIDARDESDQINATFEALLRISQIEAGSRRTRFRDVDLTAVMGSVAEIYTDVADDNRQFLSFGSRLSAPVLVNGDREVLTRLLSIS